MKLARVVWVDVSVPENGLVTHKLAVTPSMIKCPVLSSCTSWAPPGHHHFCNAAQRHHIDNFLSASSMCCEHVLLHKYVIQR